MGVGLTVAPPVLIRTRIAKPVLLLGILLPWLLLRLLLRPLLRLQLMRLLLLRMLSPLLLPLMHMLLLLWGYILWTQQMCVHIPAVWRRRRRKRAAVRHIL